MPRVVTACATCRQFTGGASTVDVEADTVQRMILALDALYPGLGAHISRSMAIAIDGEIHQDALGATLRPDSEVYLIPKIGGG